MPVAIGVVWALGFLAIMLARCRSWLGVRAALRASTPIELPIPVRALITPGAEEPGIVGFLRPVLVLPAQLLEHLNPRQLGAILTHELCHVRRRDNLFAAVHMVVEAIFWFHPLVWWIGSRMVEERELACDEEVLRMGCEPADYVQGILKVCRFYTESPLPCISGVTGADVKRRLRAILAGSIAHELSVARKMTLATIALAALAVPVLIGVLNAPAGATPIGSQDQQMPSVFEVASVKRNSDTPSGRMVFQASAGGRLTVQNMPLRLLIQHAYDVRPFQVSNGPSWIDNERYDIVAKADTAVSEKQVVGPMLRALLEDRFRLKLHRETKELPVLNLTQTSGGKLTTSKSVDCADVAPAVSDAGSLALPCHEVVLSLSPTSTRLRGEQVSTGQLTVTLANILGRPVLDNTAFAGKFDLDVEVSLEGLEGSWIS